MWLLTILTYLKADGGGGVEGGGGGREEGGVCVQDSAAGWL